MTTEKEWRDYRRSIMEKDKAKKRKKEETAQRQRAAALEYSKMHKNGLTLKEIGEAVGYTREYIRVVMSKYPDTKLVRHDPRKIEVTIVCLNCQKTKKFFLNFCESKNNKLFCNRKCYHQYIHKNRLIKTKEDYRKFNREKCHLYYNKRLKGSPEFKKLTKERNRRYAEKLKKDPQKEKAIKERAKRKMKKLMSDPIFAAKMRAQFRANFLKKMQDPVKHRKYLDYVSAYQKRRRAKINKNPVLLAAEQKKRKERYLKKKQKMEISCKSVNIKK